MSETVDPAQPDFDDPAVHACRRIIDAAEDHPPGYELASAVALEISDLDAEQRGDVIGLLAATVSKLCNMHVLRRGGQGDVQVMDRATHGIVKAAQNYRDLATFDESFRMWTECLTRHQLAKVTATLAAQLACFYQSDSMSDRGRELVSLLEAWLRAGDGDSPEQGK